MTRLSNQISWSQKKRMFFLVPVPCSLPVDILLWEGWDLVLREMGEGGREVGLSTVPSFDLWKEKFSYLFHTWIYWFAKRAGKHRVLHTQKWPGGEIISGILLPFPQVPFFHSLKFLWQMKSKKQKNISFKLFYLRIKPREHWISAWNGNVLFVLIKMQGGCTHSGIRDKETLVSGTAFIFMAFKWPEAALRSLEKPESC